MSGVNSPGGVPRIKAVGVEPRPHEKQRARHKEAADPSTPPQIEVQDEGFKGVLQTDDKVTIRQGGATSTMTVADYVAKDHFGKGTTPEQRLAELATTGSGFSVAWSLRRFAGKPSPSPIVVKNLSDSGQKEVIDLDADKVNIEQGDQTYQVPVREYLTSATFDSHGHPSERLAKLTQLGKGFAVNERVRAFIDKTYSEDEGPIVGLKEEGHPGILQPSDRVVVNNGDSTREMTVEEYLRSDEFAHHGLPSDRLWRIANRDGGYAISEPLSSLMRQMDQEAASKRKP
ncbi:MAG: hypothetical protein HYT76_07695 [Deltaproteobacteria bacterium]|nr:hypothetical protein [Deltaproteobacteria bacterium]